MSSQVANVALNKPAYMSSVSTEFPHAVASKAVDGIANTDHRMHSCSRVQEGDGHPWWQVDLTASHVVIGVTITSHGDMLGKSNTSLDYVIVFQQ